MKVTEFSMAYKPIVYFIFCPFVRPKETFSSLYKKTEKQKKDPPPQKKKKQQKKQKNQKKKKKTTNKKKTKKIKQNKTKQKYQISAYFTSLHQFLYENHVTFLALMILTKLYVACCKAAQVMCECGEGGEGGDRMEGRIS